MVFFSGWIGYATASSSGAFVEPNDAAYSRRPVTFSQLSNGYTTALNGGTVGPASFDWGLLVYLGLFGSQAGGQPLIIMPLARPVAVPARSTFSEAAAAYTLRIPNASRELSGVWPIGALLGTTQYGARCTTGANIQMIDGQVTELALAMNGSTSAGSLPASPGATGALWNNGGVISVS